MKKYLSIITVIALTLTLSACSSKEEIVKKTGSAMGYGGELTVEVEKSGSTIKSVTVTSNKETESVAAGALKTIPEEIVKKNSTDVDTVSGATVTSKAIIKAVKVALGEKVEEADKPVTDVTEKEVTTLYKGTGISNLAGTLVSTKDSNGKDFYYINQIIANTLFDENGVIVGIEVDQLELGSPNIKNPNMPHFYGYPGQTVFADEDHDGTVDGEFEITEVMFLETFETWLTKRERGETYVMNGRTWAEQMDAFQDYFVGKTIEEIKAWYAKYTSDVNGRPLLITDSSDKKDVEKYNKLTDEEKKELDALIVAGATMSVNDAHGNIFDAIIKSYDNKVKVEGVSDVSKIGLGVKSSGRVGPGKDDKDGQIYSVNEVIAFTMLDDEGKITNISLDQVEFTTPNSKGEKTPNFTGWPGQKFMQDANHDGFIDGESYANLESLQTEISTFTTKKALGDDYKFGLGTWADQAKAVEELFIGMTAEEVMEWYNKNTSDATGKPLKITENSTDADKEKFNKLTEAEQNALVDVTAGLTMSLNDSHGDIVGAIVRSIENATDVNIKVK